MNREYHVAHRKGATLPIPDRPVGASEAEAHDNISPEYALSGASESLEPRHPNTIPIDALHYHDLSDQVVAHPEMVPWWIREDLTPAEGRRALKATTALMVTFAERLGVTPPELLDLLTTILEQQDSGSDRRDLEVGMETALLALDASL